jgi:anti-anti-sigma regulatory factor
MSQVTFVDSGALGMLILARDAAAQRQIQISILGAVGQPQKTLLTASFDTLFEMK